MTAQGKPYLDFLPSNEELVRKSSSLTQSSLYSAKKKKKTYSSLPQVTFMKLGEGTKKIKEGESTKSPRALYVQ